MNEKKSVSNEAYKEDQLKILWLEYGHEPDLKDHPLQWDGASERGRGMHGWKTSN
jgi:hypothetical protein